MLSEQDSAVGSSQVAEPLKDCVASVRQAFVAHDRSDLVAWLDEVQLEHSDARPVVVVAGETKRGKSAFINALLGRPGLSPSGLDHATNAFVRFWYAETERVDIYTPDGEATSARVSDLHLWATEAENPRHERNV